MGVPVYTHKEKNIVTVNALKDYALIGFFKGVLLFDIHKILSQQGNLQSDRLVKFTDVNEIVKLENVLKSYIIEAVAIEESGKKIEFKKIRNQYQSNCYIPVKKTLQVMRLFCGPDFLKDPERRTLRTIWKNHFMANDRVGLVKAVKGVLFREGITGKIKNINHPATIIVGANHQLTAISKAKILSSNIINSSLAVFPRAGCMSPVEEPDIINTIIEDHLIRLTP